MTRPNRHRAALGALALAVALLALQTGAFAQDAQISETSRQKYDEASRMIAAGDFAGAQAKLETLVKMEEGFARGYFDLGYCMEQSGDLAGAATNYSKAFELDSSNTDYALGASKAHYRGKDYQAALDVLTPLATDDNEDAKIWLQLARTQEKLKTLDAASASALKATELDPENAEAFYVLGSVEYDRNRKAKQFDQATAALMKSLELAPDQANAFVAQYKLGKIHYYTKKYAEAEKHYALAIELRPNSYSAYVALGDSQYKRKDLVAAIASFEKAIELKQPEVYGMGYYKLAPVYFDQDEAEKSLESYEKALTDPKFKYGDRARTAMASIQDYLDKKNRAGNDF